MNRLKARRQAFRPSIEGSPLESRLALSGATAALVEVPQAPGTATPYVTTTTYTARQLNNAFAKQTRIAMQDLRNQINAQIDLLYQNGSPTTQQLAEFNQGVKGAVNATAYRLSSQAALLPGSSARLIPGLQDTLLSGRANSLVGRIEAAIQRPRNFQSIDTLKAAIGYNVNQTNLGTNYQLNRFFNTTPLNRLSVDQTGQRVPLQQYIASGILSQFGNNLSSLSRGYSTVANSMLFGTPNTAPSQTALNTFAQQSRGALSLAAFQLGNNLSLFSDAATGIVPSIQQGLFANPTGTGTGTGGTVTNPSLFQSLQNLPMTSGLDFGTAAQTGFQNGYATVAGGLNSYFGLPSQTNFNLPSGPATNIFGEPYANFGGGFNSGFGSGFPGFGPSAPDFNPTFGTGFSGVIDSVIPSFGYDIPKINQSFTPVPDGGFTPVPGPGGTPTSGGGFTPVSGGGI